MEQQTITRDKKSFLQNDPLLVCGMLVVYGVCILGLIGATFWGLDRRNRQISADATATAFAVATQQANATATAAVHVTEQAEYEYIDRFDIKRYAWSEETTDDEYSLDQKKIADGVYTWDISEVKKSFVAWENFYIPTRSLNYDVYVDTRIVTVTQGRTCSGLLFGQSPLGFDYGAFVFVVCNDSTYYLSYYDEKDDWQDLVDSSYSPFIRTGDWNRLEASLRGDHLAIFINGEMVYETTDERLAKGKLALIVDLDEEPAKIQFDNFGYQPR